MNCGSSGRMVIRAYRESDHDEVVRLWREVFPDGPSWNDPSQDIARKLEVQRELFLLAYDEAQLIGTAMAGYDGHRGWVYYVAVTPTHRRRGAGGALMRRAEQELAKLGCTKVNLQVRVENAGVVAFYRALGYVVEERVSLGKRM